MGTSILYLVLLNIIKLIIIFNKIFKNFIKEFIFIHYIYNYII